jgi:hypothetical protein
MGVGLDGMTNVALPPRPSGAVAYGPDLGYCQMELLPTQLCADLLVSSFLFFYLLVYLSDFLCDQAMPLRPRQIQINWTI